MKIITNSSDETMLLGKKYSSLLKGGDRVVLEGNLGGGKSTFARGVLKGLGFKNAGLSPTFTLMREYKKKGIHVYHIDLYRLKGHEFFGWGLEDALNDKKGILLLEWGSALREYLGTYTKIKFTFLGFTTRAIDIVFDASQKKTNNFTTFLLNK